MSCGCVPNHTGAIHRHVLLLYFQSAGDCLKKAHPTTPHLHRPEISSCDAFLLPPCRELCGGHPNCRGAHAGVDAPLLNIHAARMHTAHPPIPLEPRGEASVRILRRCTNAAPRHLQEAVRLRPNYADAYTGMGVSLKELKRKDEAEHCFAQVVHLRPGCALSLGNLAGGQHLGSSRAARAGCKTGPRLVVPHLSLCWRALRSTPPRRGVSRRAAQQGVANL